MRHVVSELQSAQAEFDNGGEPKQNHSALLKTLENYRELVDHVNSIILRFDKNGNITFINRFGQAFLGYGEEEIVGRNAIGTIVPETDKVGRDLRQMIKDIVSHPISYLKYQNENMLGNGERVWVSWTNKPTFDENGNLKETLSVGIDHTELRRVEEELRRSKQELEATVTERTAKLRESEERFRVLVEHAPDAILVYNVDLNRFVDANKKAEELFGYSHEELILIFYSAPKKDISF